MRWMLPVAALLLAAAVSATSPPVTFVNDAAIQSGVNPATLADFGFFSDPAGQVPAKGVTPYRLNTPLWSDGAEKRRFLYLPPGQQAVAPDDEGLLVLPVGAALIKTFSFGASGHERMIETRVLLHRADGWVALPYQWNEAQTEARLVLGGARVNVTTPAGQAISYAIPNRNQCKECHASGDVLTPIGPKLRNLSTAWLAEQVQAGTLAMRAFQQRRIPLWEDRASAPVADVARGYLDVNCAHCHNPVGAASNAGLDLRWEQYDPLKIGIGKRPVAAGRDSGGLDFDIVPGDPDHSIMLYRMTSLEGGVAMPELGRASIDVEGVAAVRAWISGLR
jgi:uncharacterized repeat protein (TIGR03806 family)